MRANLLIYEKEIRKRKVEKLNELFEVQLRPLKSKNVRAIYQIIVEMRGIPFLTTFDIQNELKKMNIDLSKKEINGWLKSLQEAGLIKKGVERGKPSATEYDDKYTFDKWSITPKGEEISDIVNYFITGKIEPAISPSIETIEEIAGENKVIKRKRRDNVEHIYICLATLKELHKTDGLVLRSKIRYSLTPEETACTKAISSFLDKGLIETVETPQTGGFRLWLSRILGILKEDDVSFRLTKKGRDLADKILS